MSNNTTETENILREWLDIQQELALADKDLRTTLAKGKSAPNRRVRKTIRNLRKMLQLLGKKLVSYDKEQLVKRKEQKRNKKKGK